MKNGGRVMLLICTISLALVIGIFIGRNLNSGYVSLQEAKIERTLPETEQAESRKDYRLDINTASKVQLMELPGIGEMIAERIIDYRSQHGFFTSTDDLLNIEGIGEKKLLQIEAFIKIGG